MFVKNSISILFTQAIYTFYNYFYVNISNVFFSLKILKNSSFSHDGVPSSTNWKIGRNI